MEEPLEQYLVLARSAKGKACESLILQATAHPRTFVFGELLELVRDKGVDGSYIRLLEVFAYGTYSDYTNERSTLPDITPNHLKKLKMLTLATLAANSTLLEYGSLMESLEMSSVRELEDLIIESIYEGLVEGKIDHKHNALMVMSSFGRDVKQEKVPELIGKLKNYLSHIESVETFISEEIKSSKDSMETKNQKKERFEGARQETSKKLKAMLEDKTDSGLLRALKPGFLRPKQ